MSTVQQILFLPWPPYNTIQFSKVDIWFEYLFKKLIKTIAYSSQGIYTSQLENYTSATEWQMAAWWGNVITFCSIKSINADILNQIHYLLIK